MGDQIGIQLFSRPWEPSLYSELTEIILRHDFPRIGLLEQGGHKYLFACIDEHESQSIWGYVLVEDAEVPRIRPANVLEFFKPEERDITLALVEDYKGIVHTAAAMPTQEPIPFDELAWKAVGVHLPTDIYVTG